MPYTITSCDAIVNRLLTRFTMSCETLFIGKQKPQEKRLRNPAVCFKGQRKHNDKKNLLRNVKQSITRT